MLAVLSSDLILLFTTYFVNNSSFIASLGIEPAVILFTKFVIEPCCLDDDDNKVNE